MKFSLVVFLASAASSVYVNAFAPSGGRLSPVALKGGMSDDVGIPCEDECAIESFPNLPDSIHPGVLSGQAMMDLLQHAKDNGKHIFDRESLRNISLDFFVMRFFG